MLKKFNQYLIVAILICLTSCENKPIPVKTDNKNKVIDSTIAAFEKKLLEQQIDSVFQKYDFNGSVAIFKDSIKLYQKENGFSDFKNKTAIDNNTIFAIGSVSKQFTAALVLRQMEQGKLHLNDPASKYLREFGTAEYKNITIHQLLNHTSGLNVLGSKLMFKSGSGFFYSNDGFNALGRIIEKVSGKSYDENAMELFKEVGMINSSTGNLFQGTNFAGAYLRDNKEFEKVQGMPERLNNKDIGIPAGGILSTVYDLHVWNNALYGGKVLKPRTLKQFASKSTERIHPVFGKMGYGYGIMLSPGKPTSYFHSGYVKGSASLNVYYPETKTSVIVLSNVADEKSKASTFRPHLEVKKITDAIENAVAEMKPQIKVMVQQ